MNMLMVEREKKRTQGKTDTARRLKCILLLPREMLLLHTGDGSKLLCDLEMLLEKEAMPSRPWFVPCNMQCREFLVMCKYIYIYHTRIIVPVLFELKKQVTISKKPTANIPHNLN